MGSNILFFLVGILVVGMLALAYFIKGSGSMFFVAILVGVIVMIYAFFNGFIGEPPK